MGSIFEDWDIKSSGPRSPTVTHSRLGLDADSDIVSPSQAEAERIPLENNEDDPEAMFLIKRIPVPEIIRQSKLPSGAPASIHSLSEASKCMIISTNGKFVYRWNSDNTKEEIELPFREDKVHRTFLDPSGNHALITTVAGDVFYLHSSKPKCVTLKKLQGSHIESVAWNILDGNASSTGSILIGTRLGAILEVELDGKERLVKQVFSMHQNMPICGLHFEKFPDTGGRSKYYVMAATANPSRYFQFIGGPDFESLFKYYSQIEKQQCTELPGDLNYCELRFFRRPQEERSRAFALLSGFGVYLGSLQYGSQNAGDQITIDNVEIRHEEAPLSIALTEFHLIYVYPHRLMIRNRLNQSIVFDRPCSEALHGVCPDMDQASFWIYSENGIYKLTIQEEDRDVWKQFLLQAIQGEVRDFEKALQFAKGTTQREKVRTAQAEHFYKKQDFIQAARLYAETSTPLEQVALLFLENNNRNALKEYLTLRLKRIPTSNRAQRTLLSTWLTEIFLDEINSCGSLAEERQFVLQNDFRHFLSNHQKDLDVNTTYSLLSSHGCVDDLLYFANLSEDYDRVLSHHIQRDDYESALFVLADIPIERSEQLIYKVAPQLLLAAPEQTVDAWIKASFLSPCKLIPALVRYEQQRHLAIQSGKAVSEKSEAVRYLEHVVRECGNTDPAIHNYLLSLYAAMEKDTQLVEFLDYFGDDYVFDLKYALRVCIQENKPKACVIIYSRLGLYEESVRLALTVDIELAKEHANIPDNDDLKKRLWLMIAKDIIAKRHDVNEAIRILDECTLLKIEDLLPSFPDFVMIDNLKEQITESLEEYNFKIDELKSDMEKFTSNAEAIREEIKSLRYRHGYVRGDQACELCDRPILTHTFYLFPCSHVFHTDCLLKEMNSHMNSADKAKVQELQRKIRTLAANTVGNNAKPEDKDTLSALRAELDSTIASECLLCGNVMIQSITLPFISKEEEEEAKQWSI